jgi:8-oxo-dGTP pyrophosphatase MutT (NUDIX family)
MENMSGSDAVHHTTDQWNATAALLLAAPVPAGRESAWTQALAFLKGDQYDDAHLVASVLVIDDGGSVLLARHHRYRKWGPLGGHLEPGDSSLIAAAARELFEETGLTAHVHPAPINVLIAPYRCRTVVEPVLHFDVCFVASLDVFAPALRANNELTGLDWFDSNSLPAPLTPSTQELVDLAAAVAASRH